MSRSVTVVRIDESSRVGDARRRVLTLADECGFDEVAKSNAAIAITELATNLVKHAQEGELILQPMCAGGSPPAQLDGLARPPGWNPPSRMLHPTDSEPVGIDVWGLDRGPGVGNLDEWLRDGYSTAGTRGAGMGAIRRLSTVFHAYSQRGKGTVQHLQLPPSRDLVPGSSIYQRPLPAPPVRIAGLSVPVDGEVVCGDGWSSVKEDDRVMMLVVDGLGHGPHAHVAAREAIAALVEHPQAGPLEVMQFAQEKLLPTRGAAVAVAEIIPSTGKVRFVGVGNIGAFIVAGGKTQRMVSLNGVVGVPPFRGRVMDYSFARPATIVFFSDGLQTQTRMDGYEGLANNDPAVIAGVLYRDFRRSRDDATAVVVSIN